MPTWGEILVELKQLQPAFQQQQQQHLLLQQRAAQMGQPIPALPTLESPFDKLRRDYLDRLATATGRSVILYATRWTGGGGDSDLISITAEDMQGFMEVIHELPGGKLDLVLHSPGGSPEAAESIVKYLRTKFQDIRVIVPHAAMSAATMLACSGNSIVMGKHSSLGPIDPQFILPSEAGRVAWPAYAIVAQFELAKEQIAANPAVLPAWLPMLRQYGPALIVRCQIAQRLSEALVTEWLEKYMFSGKLDAKTKAKDIACALASHADHMSHGRFIDREQARGLGLNIDELEADQNVQDAALSVFHATMHTFAATGCVKIIENNRRRAWIKHQQQQQMVMLPQGVPQPGLPFPVRPPGPPTP